MNNSRPASPLPELDAAQRALHARDPAGARTLLENALARHPDHPDALRLLATTWLHQGRPHEALPLLQRAVAGSPGDARLHSDLGGALEMLGDVDGAIATWKHASALDPNLPSPLFNLGRAMQYRGDSEASLEPLQRLRMLQPGDIKAAVLLGNSLVHVGRFDEAQEQYREALRIKPDCGSAWCSLSDIKTRPLTAADARILGAQLSRRDIAHDDRIQMGHALGKLEEDRGNVAQAYALFTASNALQQRLTPWRPAELQATLAHVVAATATLPAPPDPALGSEVIFVVGLPRTGSTLFEQILAAHPHVEGADELDELSIVLDQESQRRNVPYPHWIAQASAQDWQRLGREYLQRTVRWRQYKPRFVDKTPETWEQAGLLRAMLPGATIIETRRDPLETAWSCFKQRFYRQPHFANSFAGIAAYAEACERSMAVFRARDPARIRLHRYEDLLADPEARIRALLADCGLDFHPACLDFHTAKRSVDTASAAQVRQPLRRDTARTPGYGPLLDPLRTALGLPSA